MRIEVSPLWSLKKATSAAPEETLSSVSRRKSHRKLGYLGEIKSHAFQQWVIPLLMLEATESVYYCAIL